MIVPLAEHYDQPQADFFEFEFRRQSEWLLLIICEDFSSSRLQQLACECRFSTTFD
jgi:hypothetical protein